MQKILTQAKNIVIFILLLIIVPEGFVNGFFAYLRSRDDAEMSELLNLTGDVYYKICMNAAIISFICTYVLAYFIKKTNRIKNWLMFLLIIGTYVVLFFVWQFVLLF